MKTGLFVAGTVNWRFGLKVNLPMSLAYTSTHTPRERLRETEDQRLSP
jgi:hypothetical protein